MKKRRLSFLKLFFFIWLFCLLGFGITLAFGTNYFKSTPLETSLGSSNLFFIPFICFICFGVLSFGLFSLALLDNMWKKIKLRFGHINKKNKNVWGAAWLVWVLVFVLIGYTVFLSIREKTLIANQKLVVPTSIPVPTSTIIPQIVDSDPIITCNIHASCGGGSKQLKKSVCDKMNCCLIDKRCGGPKFIAVSDCNNSFCCLLRDGTGVLLSSKSACDNYYTSKNTGSNTANTSITTYYPCRLCYHYPSGDKCVDYTYLVKSKAECDAEQTKLDAMGSSYVLPTNIPTNAPTQANTTTNNNQACDYQYQKDVQAARTWGGTVAEAMLRVAYDNYRSCLNTGNVTPVNIVQDTRPRDRNGKLCSEYDPAFLSLSQSMGCP